MDEERELQEAVEASKAAPEPMEERLDELGEEIDEAKHLADERREEANPGAVAGDWEGEATGSHQGDDAEDAV